MASGTTNNRIRSHSCQSMATGLNALDELLGQRVRNPLVPSKIADKERDPHAGCTAASFQQDIGFIHPMSVGICHGNEGMRT